MHRVAEIACLLAAVFLILFLVIPGLRWGLPSRTINQLILGADTAEWRAPEGTDEALAQAWSAYPNYLSDGRKRIGKLPRSAFNPIRTYHPDEHAVFKSLANMKPNELYFSPGFFGWPAFHFYVVGGSLGASSLSGIVTLAEDPDFYFQNPEQMARLYVVGRVVTLLFAIGCVVIIWRAARQLFGPAGGAAAALLLAVTPLFAVNAHYMTADVPMLFWMALTLLASTHILRGGGWKWYILGGLFLGIAAATRYQGVVAAFSIAAAHFLRPAEPIEVRPQKVPVMEWLGRRLASKQLWLAALISMGVFFLFNPYILLEWQTFWREFTGELRSSGNPMSGLLSLGLFLESGLGILFSAVALGALWMAAVQRCREMGFVLLAFGVPAVLLWIGRPAMVRYMMPVLFLPVLAAAWAFAAVHRKGLEKRKRGLRFVMPVLLAILLAVIGWQSYAYCRLFSDSGSDTRTRAAQWLARIPAGAAMGIVLTKPDPSPWTFELPPLDEKRYKIVPVKASWNEMKRMADEGGLPEYFVCSDLQFPPIQVRHPLNAEEKTFWNEVFRGGKLYRVIESFEAWPLGRKVFLRRGPHDMRYPNPKIVVAQRVAQKD